MREVKFRLFHKAKIFGYERLTDKGWESMCPFLNPVGGERWTPVVFSNSIEGVRQQFIGRKDKKDAEIYEGDIMKVMLRTEGRGKQTRYKEVNMLVYWNESEAGFVLQYPKDYGHYRFMDGNWSAHEIIGNIIKNPDLFNP